MKDSKTGGRIRGFKGCQEKGSLPEDQRKQESRAICPRMQSDDAAKDEQRDIEARIEELEKILKNAEVFVEEEADLDKVSIGCQVKILDCEFDEELTYKIVGSTEANSLKGKISNESPVGKALLGKKIGDTVTVTTPAGEFEYKILSIHRSSNE